MDPLEEEARLFAVTYGSEETPITSTGPPVKGGTPVPAHGSTATSPIDEAIKRRAVRQPLNFEAQPSATGAQSAKARREHILASLPRPVHGHRKHRTNTNLFDFDEIEFAQWILELGAPDSGIDRMRHEPVDGSLWKELVTNGSGQLRETASSDISELWPDATKFFIIKLLSESRNHLVQVQQQQEAEKGLTTRELMAIRFAPMPTAQGLADRLSHEQLKAMKSSLIAQLQDIQGAEQYAKQMEHQIDHPNIEDTHRFLNGCTRTCRQTDSHLAAKLMEAAQQTFMHNIIIQEGHRYEGRASGLCIMTSIATTMTSMTAYRMGSLLKDVFKPLSSQVVEYQALEPAYKEFVEAKNTLGKLGVELPPQIESFLLQEMASRLAGRSNLNLILGIPMSKIIQEGFDDPMEMEKLIQSTIHEINNSPGKYVNRPPNPSLKFGQKPPPKNPVNSITTTPARRSDRLDPEKCICINRREASWSGMDCIKKPGLALGECKKIHLTDANPAACQDPDYAEFGRCIHYFTTCKFKHP